MSITKLNAEQLRALRATPLNGSPNRIAAARRLARATQTDLAAAVGCEQSQISGFERRGCSVAYALAIAGALGCSVEDLFPRPKAQRRSRRSSVEPATQVA